MFLTIVVAYAFTPIAFMIGVPWSDSFAVGRLVAVKLIFNEFVAFKVRGPFILFLVQEDTKKLVVKTSK